MDIKKYEKEVMEFLNNLSDEDFLKLLNDSDIPTAKCYGCNGKGFVRYEDYDEGTLDEVVCEICEGTGLCR